VVLAALFFSTAGVLAHTLHERGLAPGALTWPAVDRRGPQRPSDDEWLATQQAAGRQPRRDQRSQRAERPRRRGRRRRRPNGDGRP
jgi:hypothetical protein